ncbi:MAG: CoA transferase [Deltaproteobacteria bacterium]|nr:CoA transferase [Candidatus Anaeroferrophillacea bacterium]
MPGPLNGIRILDFSTLLPGPFATMMLADLGADVLKVEAPHRPDYLREGPPYDDGVSGGHMALNRGKRSLTLDLKIPEAVTVAKRLVRSYDIVIEQFRPGVMERLGLGYETLRRENDALIYCSITGYGQNGPYRDRAGHDINFLAISGILSCSGREAHGPVPQGVQIADLGGGSYHAVVGILAAVIHRHRTGEGQYLDVSMTDGAISWGTFLDVKQLVGGDNPGYESEFLSGGSFYDCYETSDGRYMSVGSIEPPFFAALCRATGTEDLIGKLGWGMEGQEIMRQAKERFRQAFAAKTQAEWIGIFKDLDACVEPVLTVAEMAQHPHIRARNMVTDVRKPDGTTQQQINSPFRFSRTRAEIRSVGPGLGEHNAEVLREIGLSAAEIEALHRNGALG